MTCTHFQYWKSTFHLGIFSSYKVKVGFTLVGVFLEGTILACLKNSSYGKKKQPYFLHYTLQNLPILKICSFYKNKKT
jgi:hypothetical protein